MRTNKRIAFDINKLILERGRQCKSTIDISNATGLNVQTIVRIENKKAVPHIQTVGRIANALGMDIEDFIISK